MILNLTFSSVINMKISLKNPGKSMYWSFIFTLSLKMREIPWYKNLFNMIYINIFKRLKLLSVYFIFSEKKGKKNVLKISLVYKIRYER